MDTNEHGWTGISLSISGKYRTTCDFTLPNGNQKRQREAATRRGKKKREQEAESRECGSRNTEGVKAQSLWMPERVLARTDI
jgi:hypothetical protein